MKMKQYWLLWWELHGRAVVGVLGLTLLLVMLGTAFVAGRLSAEATDTAVREPPLAITATPTAVIPITAPTAVSTYVNGVGELVGSEFNWRIGAVGTSYFNGTEMVREVHCDPLPSTQECIFPRPPVPAQYASSFSLAVRDDGGWQYLAADVRQDSFTVEWGIYQGVFRYLVGNGEVR